MPIILRAVYDADAAGADASFMRYARLCFDAVYMSLRYVLRMMDVEHAYRDTGTVNESG